MAVVTKQELEDASVDAQTLEDVINGAPDINGTGLVTSRLGQVIKTVSKSIQDLNTVGVVTSAISALEVELGAPASSLVIETNGNVKVPNGINATTTLVLKTAGTERVRVDADGLKFNGDTAAANGLDDYEEGVWTPSFAVESGDAPAPTFVEQTGKYTKIGNLVSCYCRIEWSAITTTGQVLVLQGLPFAAASSTNMGIVTNARGVTFTDRNAVTGTALAAVPYSPTACALCVIASGASGNDPRIDPSQLASAGLIEISLSYFTS